MQTPIEFLRHFYGHFEHEGVFTLIAMLKVNEDGSKKGKSHNRVFKFPLSEVPSFNWATIKELNDQKYDIYFGEALRNQSILEEPNYVRGVANACDLTVALTMDIDLKTTRAHASDTLPETMEDVAKILDIGPDPSIVINSGHGYHVHWLYTESVLLRDKTERNQYSRFRKKAHAPYMKAHKDHGWKGDATHGIDRIWRIPGFQNWKLPFDPVPVEALMGMEERVVYDHASLVPESTSTKPRPVMPRSTPRQQAQQAKEITDLRKSIKSYVEKCYDDAMALGPDDDEAEDIARRGIYMQRVLDGESIEDKGQRDQALTTVCGILCHLTRNITEFTEDDLEYIVTDVLSASLQKWCDDNEDTDLEREMGKAIDKLRRIKNKDQDETSEALKGMRKALSNYTPREMDPLDEGSEQEPEIEVTDEELLRSGIITFGGYKYIMDWESKRYFERELKDKDEILLTLRQSWPSEGCAFIRSVVGESGEVDLPLTHILKNYGTNAKDAYLTYLEPYTRYDIPTGTLRINPRPWRQTEPGYSSEIDQWLKLLGGEKNYELLCDWLAGVIKLDRPCAALYLDGPPGCGKTLLAHGASQLWSDYASLYESSAGDFNDGLLNSPVLMVDEGFSASNIKNPTAVLRRLVALSTHSVNKKYGAKLRLDGHIRVIIAANNADVLLSGKEEHLSENDTRAMKERIAYVKIRDDGARNFFIKNNKGNRLTNQWLAGGHFARHVLWLAEQRPLNDRGRFLVEGQDSPMHNQMIFQGNERNEVLEWTCLFAEAPLKLNARIATHLPKPAVIGDGIVGVSTQHVLPRWDEYSTNKDGLTHSHLIKHLKSLSPLDASIQIRVGEKIVRYWVIPIDLILSYADSHDIGDMDTIRALAQSSTDITTSIINNKHYRALLGQK